MKKKRIVIVTIIVRGVLVLSFFIGTGFSRRTDVVLTEYSVSEELQKNVDTGELRKQASVQTEPSVIKTYEVTNSEFAEKYFENDQWVTMVRYYEMSDGTWKTDDYTFQYRLVITGRMNNAAKDSTFVFFE